MTRHERSIARELRRVIAVWTRGIGLTHGVVAGLDAEYVAEACQISPL